MASLYITEYMNLGRSVDGHVVMTGEEPAVATQKVTYTTTTQSTAFKQRTRFLRVLADADAHLAFAVSPTATASSPLYKANIEYWIAVEDTSGTLEVAAYDGTS